MDENDAIRLSANRELLVRDLEVKQTLDYLVSDGILDAELEAKIMAKKTRFDQARELIQVLPSRGPEAYSVFRTALVKIGQAHLVKGLDNTDIEVARRQQRVAGNSKMDVLKITQLSSLGDVTLDGMSLEIRGKSSSDVIIMVSTVKSGDQSCHVNDHPAGVAAAAIVPDTRCLQVNYMDKFDSSTIIPASGATGDCRFSYPTGVAYCTHTNTILVADHCNNHIMRYDMDGSNRSHFVRPGDTGCGKYEPCDVATSRVSGRVFVTDTRNQRVLVFTRDGDYVTSIGSRGTGDGQFVGVRGITCHNGCVLVCDDGNHRVTMVTEDGVHIRHIVCGLIYPQYVAVGPGDTIYVTNCDVNDVIGDRFHGNVHVYRWDRTPVRQFGHREGAGSRAGGVTVDHQGYVCVAWEHHHRVDVYNPQRELYTTFGREGEGPGELWCPLGLELLPDGRVVVCDCYNNRLVIF